MLTRQLLDLLNNAIYTLSSEIVKIIETNNSKFQVECSNLTLNLQTTTIVAQPFNVIKW